MARFTFPAQPARQRPDQRRRQRPARRLRRGRSRSRPPRNRRHRLQRPLLRPAPALPGLLRRRLRPPLRRLRHLGAKARSTPAATAAERQPGARRQPARPRAQAGAYASFDTRHNRTVTARVGVSFVSVDGARANLAAESPGRGFGAIAARRRKRWNQALGRIRVSGGPPRLLDTFYTALYHAFLAPRTFSDVGGAYIGMDGLVHRARGRTQYADFSGWDTYRTQIQLLSMLAPRAGQRHGALAARRRRRRAAACRAGPTPTARA